MSLMGIALLKEHVMLEKSERGAFLVNELRNDSSFQDVMEEYLEIGGFLDAGLAQQCAQRLADAASR